MTPEEMLNDQAELSVPSILESLKNVIDWHWRSGRDTVGIVAVWITPGKEWTAYIGVAKGTDEGADVAYIRKYGARLTLMEAMAFFPALDPHKYGKE